MARRSSKGSDGASDTRDETQIPETTPPEGDIGQDSIPPETGSGADEAMMPPDDGAETVTVADAETVAPDADMADTPETTSDPVPDATGIFADVPADPAEDSMSPEGEDTIDAEAAETADADGDASERDDETPGTEGEDTLAAVEADSDAAPEAPEAPEAKTPETEKPNTPPPATVVEKRGPGFVPLLLGGVVAAGLGYGATYMGYLPMPADDAAASRLESVIAQQSETLSALQAQVTALGEAPATAGVDLAPLSEQIGALETRLSETTDTIADLATRITTLEDRPLFSGDVDADLAAAAETVTELEGQLRAQEEEAARIEAEATAAQDAAAEAAAQAEAAIAEAEAQAQAALEEAAAEAALGELRIAVTTGAPFAEAVATISAATEVPQALTAAAENGVATVEELQDGFPAAARAALPVALRETAGEDPVERFTAFLQGQVGGRSIEPREGDDPDAVLSRAQAAVDRADFAAALTEIAALPETAQAEMADWMAQAETRAAVDAALVTVADALAGSN
ncbi:COG4223 family protein [Roseicyclus elongatus]|uniref:COG4223 family protein n=1 Tax=Roseicyclus elongatus TaxID=159346 RepID=UPI0012EBA67C|nr:hypothetical protein [Roseibacterium elongatum]